MSVLWAKRGWMSGGTFVPHQLFASGAQGAWYDPSDFSTLFQDAAGTTPVTAVEQPVRLMLDRSGRGNHATAPNDASRPVLRARYNLLTRTEEFDNAVWVNNEINVTANAAVAPDGAATAELFVPTANAQVHRVYSSGTNLTAVSGAYSLYAKANGYTKIGIRESNTSGAGAAFDLSGSGSVIGAFNAGGSTVSAMSITSVGNGWFRIALSISFGSATAQSLGIHLLSASYSAGTTIFESWAANGTDGILIWGAQLLTAADQSATGGAYQRIAAATDYDTSNPVWRPYLAFDGSDDSLSTSSIDFSGTDEMTVFAGVTKLSDAAQGMLAELTSSSASNNGAFTLLAPDTPNDYAWASKGTTRVFPVANGFDAPITNVLTGIGDISGDVATLRVNGTQAATSASDQGTGNYSNAPLFIGRRNNASLPFNGRLYSLAVLGRTATAPELTAMESWIAGKTGVNLP